MNSAPDIEIYVKNLSQTDAEHWLKTVFSNVEPMKKKKGMPKGTYSYRATWNNNHFSAVIFEGAAPGYTSIWLNTNTLPWSSDENCAQAAAGYFQKSVRVTAGGWEQDDDADAWIEISPTGESTHIIWKTS